MSIEKILGSGTLEKTGFWKNRPKDNVLAQSVNSTKCVVFDKPTYEYKFWGTKIIFWRYEAKINFFDGKKEQKGRFCHFCTFSTFF